MRILLISDWHRGFSPTTHILHRKAVKKWPDFDVLVCAGDMGSHKFAHFEGAYKFFRKVAGDRPILSVLGNHDYWDRKGIKNFSYLIKKQNQVFRKYNIHCLSRDGAFELDGHVFTGVDGAYKEWGNTNDIYYFPLTHQQGMPIERFLQLEEQLQIMNATVELESARVTNKKTVLVNHIPFHQALWSLGTFKPKYSSNNRNWLPFEGLVDYYFYGHTHQGIKFKHNDCLIVNCGADYDEPNFQLIDTQKE